MISSRPPPDLTIVYVEDNVGDAEFLREALKERGFAGHFMVFKEGEDAMRYFTAKESLKDVPLPDCILLDANLPVVTGAQLLRFIRGSRVFDKTPVYIFASERDYEELIKANVVSKESFITKSTSWQSQLNLADLLMQSAKAQQDGTPASPTDSRPEVHAEGPLRRHDTQLQRDRAKGPPKP